MTRYAEDLIWANKIESGEEVFRFIVTLTDERADADDLRKGKFLTMCMITFCAGGVKDM